MTEKCESKHKDYHMPKLPHDDEAQLIAMSQYMYAHEMDAAQAEIVAILDERGMDG